MNPAEEILTLVNPVSLAKVDDIGRLPAWRFAEARTENNIRPPTPFHALASSERQ